MSKRSPVWLIALVAVLLLHSIYLHYRLNNTTAVVETEETPVALEHIIAPWKPQQAVVITLPIEQIVSDAPELLDLYLELIRVVTRYMDVIVTYSINHRENLPIFVRAMEADTRVSSNPGQVRLLETEAVTMWIRDYGPNFGVNRDGQLRLINNTFDLDRMSLEDAAEQTLRTLREGKTNAYLGNALPRYYGYELDLLNTGLSIHGGNFLYAGKGRLITSDQIVVARGESKQVITQALADTLGLSEVHYLPRLPGASAGHLDMYLNVIDEAHAIISLPPERAAFSRYYMDTLYAETADRFIYARDYLEAELPEMTIHTVPMLPIVLADREEAHEWLRNLVLAQFGQPLGIDWYAIQANGSEAEQSAALRGIGNALRETFGDVNLYNEEDLNRIAQRAFNTDLEQVNKLYVEHKAVYRSYTNSLYLHNAAGEEAFILPRYLPRNEAEVALVERFEEEVEAAYRAARPQATLHWIEVDAAIDQLGSVHCFTATVPYWPPQ